MTRYILQIVLLLLVTLYAYRKGGAPERHVACVLVSMHAAGIGYFLIADQWVDYSGHALFRVAVDVVALIALTIIALRANRWWPLWVSSVQLLAVMAHVLKAVEPDMPLLIWNVMERWPFWAAIVLTGIGTHLYARRNSAAASMP